MSALKKIIVVFFILALPAITGCQNLNNPFSSNQPKTQGSKLFSNEQSGSNPYLAKGATISGRSEREMLSASVSDGMSREELLMKVVDCEDKYKQEKKKREELELEVKTLQRDFGQRIFMLQNNLINAHKEIEELKIKASNAHVKMIEAKRKSDNLKMNMLQKKSLMDSKFPIFYEVIPGDTLWAISGRNNIYKDNYKWIEIYTANKQKLEDPDIIYPGQVRKIPRYFDYFLGVPESGDDLLDAEIDLDE